MKSIDFFAKNMTAQFSEGLHYKDKLHSLFTLPLEPYLDLSQTRNRLEGIHSHTACERRYVGIWKIIEDKLYLERLDNVSGDILPLDRFFKDQSAPIFAEWFSGELRCPKGELLKYVHFGFGSIYERDLIITVRNGVIESERIVTNQPPPPRDPSDEFNIPEFLLRR
ncbi:MAG TPA: hypothetical protein VFF81_08940 [Noviherbaspirillum sp.]|nr:hypothetical protein [Noviherbaspirillum sp.]